MPLPQWEDGKRSDLSTQLSCEMMGGLRGRESSAENCMEFLRSGKERKYVLDSIIVIHHIFIRCETL